MGKYVVAFIAAVCNENDFSRVWKSVCHLANGLKFILLTARLNQRIQISFAAKIIQRIQMQQIKSFLTGIGLKVIFAIFWISGNIQVCSITSNKSVSLKQFFKGNCEVEAMKQIEKGIWRNQRIYYFQVDFVLLLANKHFVRNLRKHLFRLALTLVFFFRHYRICLTFFLLEYE